MRRVIAFFICLSMMVVSAGCETAGNTVSASATVSAQQSTQQTPSQTPTPTAVKPALSLTMSVFAETSVSGALSAGIGGLKKQSGGSLEIALNDNTADAAAGLDKVISGDTSIYLGDVRGVSVKVPQLAVCKIPMLFSNADACNKMLSGGFVNMMQPYFNSAGLELLGAYCPSIRNLTSSKAIAKASDLKSLRIRTEDGDAYDSLFWEAAKCFPSELAWGNVNVALKQKMLEAQESTNEDINSYKLYEVQGYYIRTNHSPEVRVIAMNKALYDGLSEDQKTWLKSFASEVEEKALKEQAARDTELEETFKQGGMKFSDASADVVTVLKSCTQYVTDHVKKKVDPTLVDAYIAAAKQG